MRVLTGALLAALLLVACGSESSDLEASGTGGCEQPAEVRAHVYEGDVINLVTWVAADTGIFRDHCLEVELVPIASGPAAVQSSVQGAVNFVNTAPDNVLRSRSEGLDLQVVANMFRLQYYALVARAGFSGPNENAGFPAVMKDLVGKKIGVTALGSTTEALARANFTAAGLDPDSATYVAVGATPTMVSALKGGSVDAVEMFGSGPELAEATGAGRIIGDLRQEGVGTDQVQALNGSTLVWAAQGDFLRRNPKAARAFMEANDAAIEWIQDRGNRRRLFEILRKRGAFPSEAGGSPKALVTLADRTAPLLGPGVDRKSIEAWSDFLIAQDAISAPVTYEEAVWEGARE